MTRFRSSVSIFIGPLQPSKADLLLTVYWQPLGMFSSYLGNFMNKLKDN